MHALNRIVSLALSLTISSLLLGGCATTQTTQDQVEQRVAQIWTLSTKYHDKRKDKKFPGTTKIIIDGQDKLRMDIYGPLGFVHVGTLIINGGQLFIKTMSGESYEGEANRAEVSKLLKIPVEPRDLFGLFQQKGFYDESWSCGLNSELQVMEECEHKIHDMKVRWSGLMTQPGTKLHLDHPRAHLRFKVKNYTEKPELDQSLFTF